MKGNKIKAFYNFLNALHLESKNRRSWVQGDVRKRNNTIEKLSLMRGGIVQALVSCNIHKELQIKVRLCGGQDNGRKFRMKAQDHILWKRTRTVLTSHITLSSKVVCYIPFLVACSHYPLLTQSSHIINHRKKPP